MPISKSDRTFWYVYNPLRGKPAVKHLSKQTAEAEAERLAKKHPGEEFYVLRAEKLVKFVNEPLYDLKFEIKNPSTFNRYECLTGSGVRDVLKLAFDFSNKMANTLIRVAARSNGEWVTLKMPNATIMVKVNKEDVGDRQAFGGVKWYDHDTNNPCDGWEF